MNESIGSRSRFAATGTHLSIDLVERALEELPFARGEEIIDIADAPLPSDIDILRRVSVT